jgi:LysM repeat protein
VPVPQHRKEPKFRRVGRHAAPCQAKVVTQKAGRAVPAVAMLGVLAVATQSHRPAPTGGEQLEAVPGPVADPVANPAGAAGLPRSAALRSARKQQDPLPEAAWSYMVQPGDTLSGIAFRFYGRARAWQWLYQVNRREIESPNLIFPGQVLSVPRDVPASFVGLSGDADPAGTASDPRQASSSGLGTGPGSLPSLDTSAAWQGTLGCSSLERLWLAAGGAPSAEVTAASVAVAESGGAQYATGPFGERGYWQINPDHGALSTYDAYGNARAAVIISSDGTNWSPWTTYVDGAYAGLC